MPRLGPPALVIVHEMRLFESVLETPPCMAKLTEIDLIANVMKSQSKEGAMRSFLAGLWWLTKLFAKLTIGSVLLYTAMSALSSDHPISGDAVQGLILLFIIVAVYFAPSIFATRRGHPNSLPIIIVNVFFGWTLIGWVAALAWAASSFEKPSAANGA